MEEQAIQSPALPRVLDAEGAFNLRDIGGYRAARGVVRQGVVLRGGHLCQLTPAGVAQLRRLGVRTVLDLRRPSEVATGPGPFGESDDPRGLNLPLLVDEPGFAGQPPPLTEVYRRILDTFQPQFRAVFEELGRPGALPALIHCTAGKDRTGLVVALLLELVGVPHGPIIADYSASEQALATASAFAAYREQAIGAGRASLLTAPGDLMASTLAYLDARYGGAAGYLAASGVSAPALERLRAALIEEDDHERSS